MFNPPRPLDHPLFTERGSSAFTFFDSLRKQVPGVWTGGFLLRPHEQTLRSEVRSHIFGHRKQQADEYIWVALRFDPLDFGRILYRGAPPELGEPSWRELGAIALERCLDNFGALARQDKINPDTAANAPLKGTPLSAGIFGVRFGSEASLRGPDYRFSYLQFSWVQDRAVGNESIIQPSIVGGLLKLLADDLDMLKRDAAARFPRGHNLEREIRLMPLSKEECEIAELDQEALRDLHALSSDETIPDVIPLDRELTEGVTPPPKQEDWMPIELPPEAQSLSELGLEEQDIRMLRERLAQHGLLLSDIPDDFERPSQPYLVEMYEGFRLFLQLRAATSAEYYVCVEQLQPILDRLSRAIDPEFRPRAEFVELVDAVGGRRYFIELSVGLPTMTRTALGKRQEILECVQHAVLEARPLFR